MNKMLVGGVLIAVLLGLGGGFVFGYVVYQPQVQSVQDDLDSLAGDLDAIEGDMDNLAGDLNAIEGDITSLQSEMGSRSSEIAGLQSQLTSFYDKILELNSDMLTVNSTLLTLQGQLPLLQSQVASLQSQLLSLQNQLSSLTAELDDLQAQISETQTSDLHMSGSLVQLPYFAKWQLGEALQPYIILLSLDIDQSKAGDQQTTFVARTDAHTISATGTFQIYSPDPSMNYGQVFFIYSWTPSWPPPIGYYYALYDGLPGHYPGVVQSFDFDLTIPSAQYGRVLYLYFCGTFQNNIEDAVSLYTEPLWVPYAVITVGP